MDYAVVPKYEKSTICIAACFGNSPLPKSTTFFADLAAQLPPDFTTNAPDPNLPFQERIASLEEENKLLNAKLEELRAVLRKG
ncbi:MAG: hypothetical protein V7655_10510 [Aequorivita antarctica]